jgi:hypothetical protein
MIDYKILLEKYVDHVKECEGVDFILFGNDQSNIDFSDEEWNELKIISSINPSWT